MPNIAVPHPGRFVSRRALYGAPEHESQSPSWAQTWEGAGGGTVGAVAGQQDELNEQSQQQEHYFSAHPASADERRTLHLPLAGQTRPVQVARGVFSPDRLDAGTTVLLRHAPAPPTRGTFLDLGCGWGPIALSLALRAPGAHVHAVDVNERAVELTRLNAEQLGLPNVHAATPDATPETTYDLIWSNPPIRVGKAALHELLDLWLPRLAPGGAACLVVQRHLGSDSLHRWLSDRFEPAGMTTTRHTSEKGYRLLRVSRAG